MKLTQIAYFLEVAKTGKVSTAAKKLYVTQPAITTAIRNLEKELEVRLFERNYEGLFLTEAGKAFERHAQKIAKEIELTLHEMTQWRPGATKALEIDIPAISGANIYRLIYDDFKLKHPEVNIAINDTYSKESLRRIIEGEHEIGFCIYNDNYVKEYGDLLNFSEFAEGEIMLLMSKKHPLAKQKVIPIEDIINDNWIFSRRSNSPNSVTEDIITEYLQNHGLPKPKIKHIEDQFTIINIVSMGEGVYLYPNTSRNKLFADYKSTVTKKIKGGHYYRIGMIYHKGSYLSSSAKTFITWYKNVIKTQR